MLESPTKRQRTSDNFPALFQRNMAVTWPKGTIPTEIFSIVVLYLPRSSVQNMRLVNKEFEEKVSHDLFRTVVVPFRPEIYGITEESSVGDGLMNSHDQDGSPKGAAVMLQDKGMRVFQGFGRHIYRFGMSFEIDYGALTKPPVKSEQEALKTFWGIYRWPFKKYNRYHQLEGLEQVADETRTMARALHYIVNAKELGLSIDGGLGWLTGPDINHRAQLSSGKPCVFGESRFRPEEKPPVPCLFPARTNTTGEVRLDTRVAALIQMLLDAGHEDSARSVLALFEAEVLPQPAHANPSPSLISILRDREPPVSLLRPGNMESFLARLGYEDAQVKRLTEGLTKALLWISEPGVNDPSDAYLLKPKNLTTAQKEMLLEIEWAQRAFMQSYTIAIIDNSSTFKGVQTLSLARLPSRHLANLHRSDFWHSLSQLQKVSLAIIPDWREVTKLATSWVEDVQIPPSRSINGVYQLLKYHIAPRSSIKSLHFEWLCGGERATGLFARNRFILAAPVLPQAMDMIHSSNPQEALLELPHVEHLTLKNCWISPHIMVRFVEYMKKAALTSLTLQSVSLTAPSIHKMRPGPTYLQQTVVPQPYTSTQNQSVALILQMHSQQVQIDPSYNITSSPFDQQTSAHGQLTSWPNQPRYGSWAHVIDQISPGETIATFLHSRDLGPEPPKRQPSKLKRITFESCGYARLPLDIDQSMLDNGPHEADTPAIEKRRKDLIAFMLYPLDPTLGTIVNSMHEGERKWLEIAWGLRLGWSDAYKTLREQSLLDGVKNSGHGRFGGNIDSFVSSVKGKETLQS